MGKIRVRSGNAKLFFDFRYMGKRHREQTTLNDSMANRKKLQQVSTRIEAEITLGTFDYGLYFPNSPKAKIYANVNQSAAPSSSTPTFRDFAVTWQSEMQTQWRETHADGVALNIEKYILPFFGEKEVGHITKAEIMEFRSSLAKVTKRNGKSLSASRINHIMTPLRMILNEAANRYEFTSPCHGIKSLRVPRTDVEPFTLEEIRLILANVRADFRFY